MEDSEGALIMTEESNEVDTDECNVWSFMEYHDNHCDRALSDDKVAGGLTLGVGSNRCKSDNRWVQLCHEVMTRGYPNAWGAQIPLDTKWNLELLDSLLINYHDRQEVEWLKFAWPLSRPPNWENPVPTFINHDTANDFPEDIDNYIRKEVQCRAVCGPFDDIPFWFTD